MTFDALIGILFTGIQAGMSIHRAFQMQLGPVIGALWLRHKITKYS